jgi:polysaccharide biosynthesis/export protein
MALYELLTFNFINLTFHLVHNKLGSKFVLQKYDNRMSLKNISLWVLLLLASSSCIQRKHLLYLHEGEKTGETYNITPPQYKIQPGDVLHVKILTIDKALQEIVEKQATQIERVVLNEASLYLSGYVVNEDGAISLPLFGLLEVAGQSVSEIAATIQKEVDEFYRDASVDVKLLSFKITILGEVVRPGTFYVYQDHLNVFEAIGKAGNMTDLAKREVLLVRQTPKGTETMRLDLADSKILASEGFYLLPNDIIIVEPGHGKSFRMNVPIFTLSFSALSALLLIINYFSQ